MAMQMNKQKVNVPDLSGADVFKMKKFAAVPSKVQTHRTSARGKAEPGQ